MLSDVRNYYGLARDFGQAGYFETEHSEQIVSELKLEIKAGKLVALSGIVGCGKTTMLRRIQEALSQDKEILASKSLSLEKSQISLATLIMALFYDLATEKDFKIPTQPERRERALRDLIKKRQKPIALFIDDAHDLHSKTLIGRKRLIEVVRDSGGMLSVVLAGHPKLKNDLRRSSMEEIGSRATIFELEGLGSEKRKYLKWLLAQSVAPKTKIESVVGLSVRAVYVLSSPQLGPRGEPIGEALLQVEANAEEFIAPEHFGSRVVKPDEFIETEDRRFLAGPGGLLRAVRVHPDCILCLDGPKILDWCDTMEEAVAIIDAIHDGAERFHALSEEALERRSSREAG
jgi:type II secretory pathway predicted ATPase ExeA